MSTRYLVLLSLAITVIVAVSIRFLDPERLSAFGQIVSGGGSLLAVLWFSAGLRYQSKQIEEQRTQFKIQFDHLLETSRRDALLVAKGILDRAEEKALTQCGNINSTHEILMEYTKSTALKTLLESTDPHQVATAFTQWIKPEGVALVLMGGIKSAAEVYLRSVGTPGIDYTKSPEDFYFIFSSHFATQPFFNSVAGTAYLLSEFMVRFQPARNTATIAYFVAQSKVLDEKVIKMDTLRADIAKHVAEGYPLPEIAKDF
jgi:hypothetical protein